ncbi:uncharacterized protein LOC129953533 [Eupeodes corollae]|uniref:uncharacterized protein LOC129953533 n=1 Tax=Eupeodes corollae TaxID=290404 RepID=UPI0024939569|nr:uncharacterized protein LOC129953533 [Eupeodes corollae]
MKFVALSVFAIAVISSSIVQGTFTAKRPCLCPMPQIVERPILVGCPAPTQKNCFYPPCNSTNTNNVCGALNGNCMIFDCLYELYNKNCADDLNIENVSMMYCENRALGQPFSPCSNL